MKTAIVIPTYNEIKNVESIIQGIFALEIPDLHIIIVDDNSPDGTGKLIEEIKNQNTNIHSIHREKKMGLGTAYLQGFKYALDNEAEYIFEMDADFSHDHSLIPTFLKEIKNHDLVLGSRYIQEGKIENWNLSRRMVSRLGNFYARRMLKIPVKDLTSGYKCYRREVIEHLHAKNINAIGYVFQIETTYLAHKNGFRIKEIPIKFIERKVGKSKFNFKIIWESFWKVFELKFKNN